MHNIAITTECVADLPPRYYKENEVDVVYFDVKTESGIFRDTVEIDSRNVIEYMVDGEKKANSVIPSANSYKNFFTNMLREYSEVIHICISSGISDAYSNAVLAKVKMGADGEKIHVIDSKHLSSGQGLIVMAAVRYVNLGLDSQEIIKNLEKMIQRVSTSFLANNADYLYYNGKVKKSIMRVCKIFHIHPVLAMIDGKLTLKGAYIGKYNYAAKKYIKQILDGKTPIDTSVGFITYAGCSEDILEMVRKELSNHITFENRIEQPASATVSSNCGPRTFGVLFARK